MSVEKEVLEALKLKQGAKESRKDFLAQVTDKSFDISDKAWNALSKESKEWLEAAQKAFNAEKPVKEFPGGDDDADSDNAPRRERGRAADEEDDRGSRRSREDSDDDRGSRRSREDDDAGNRRRGDSDDEGEERATRSRRGEDDADDARGSRRGRDRDEEDDSRSSRSRRDEDDEKDDRGSRSRRDADEEDSKSERSTRSRRDADDAEEDRGSRRGRDRDDDKDADKDDKGGKDNSEEQTTLPAQVKTKIRDLLLEDPAMTPDAIIKALKSKTTVSKVLVSDIKAEWKATVKHLQDAKQLKKAIL